MKKIICLMMALLLAVLTLSACHGTLVPDTTAAQTEAQGETKESGESGEGADNFDLGRRRNRKGSQD